PSGWTGDEAHPQISALAQAQHGGDSILLRASDNQPGDDMGNAHSKGAALHFFDPLRDIDKFRRALRGALRIKLPVFEGGLGVFLSVGDVEQAEMDLIRNGGKRSFE